MIVQFLRTHTQVFRTRAPARDQATDRTNVASVATAIGEALARLESEKRGLNQRVSDVLSRAAITAGNGDDEYLTREATESAHLKEFEAEIKRGQNRLNELERNITRFRAVRGALEFEFPEHFVNFRQSAAE